MEGGGWRVEGGGWRVEGGGWRVEGTRGPARKQCWVNGEWSRVLEGESAPSGHSGGNSYFRLIDSCITQLKAQGPSRTCNESKEEEEEEATQVQILSQSPTDATSGG